MPIDFIVQENVAQITNNSNWRMTFDMKGSTVNRNVSIKEHNTNFWRKQLHYRRTMKDVNWLTINKDLGEKLMKLRSEACRELN